MTSGEDIIKPFRVQEVVTEITEADGDICLYNLIVLSIDAA